MVHEAKQRSGSISAVSVTRNTRGCLFAQDHPGTEQLILMSEWPDPEIERDGVEQIGIAKGLGLALNWNLGAARATGDYVLFWDDRYELAPGGLKALIAALESDPAVGAVGPLISKLAINPRAMSATPTEVDRLGGAGLLVRRELLDKIGGFGPAIANTDWLVHDFCMRAQLVGYRLLQVDAAAAMQRSGERYEDDETQLHAWEAFAEKWSLPVGRNPVDSWSDKDIEGVLLDHRQHYVPLKVTPLPLVEATGTRFLTHVHPEDATWEQHVSCYIEAFDGADDVTLMLRIDDSQQTDDIIQKIQNIAEQRGTRIEDTPDLLLVDLPFRPGDQASLFASAHAALPDASPANRAHLRLAELTGCPVIQEVTPSSLRAALKEGA